MPLAFIESTEKQLQRPLTHGILIVPKNRIWQAGVTLRGKALVDACGFPNLRPCYAFASLYYALCIYRVKISGQRENGSLSSRYISSG